MLKLALVGFGGFGWQLAEGIGDVSQTLDCRLVAAADSRLKDLPDKAGKLAARGVELHDDAREMFDKLTGRCDAVYIATSIQSHAALAVAAAEAGLHIHLEKPPAATVQEVDAIAAAVERAGVLCLVGFQAVHGSDCRFLKDRIAGGRMGKVRSLTCHAGWPRAQWYYTRNEWAGRLRAGASWVLDGPAGNALSHQLNNLLYLAGGEAMQYATPTAVRGELYAAGPVESHNIAAIEMLTDCGPTAHCILAHCTDQLFGPVITVEAEHARAVWTIYQDATITYADGSVERCADVRDDQAEMLTNFLAAVRSGDGAALRCKLADARNMVLALNGAHESSGRIHRVDDAAIRWVGDGGKRRAVVAGLDELLPAAAGGHCLLSDVPDAPPWTVATEQYDLAGYHMFPRRFRCD